MESTGVYWKPVWNLLEGQFEVLLVNAQHIQAAVTKSEQTTSIRLCYLNNAHKSALWRCSELRLPQIVF